MSFTRLRNDPARLQKESEISSYSGRYYMVVPGMGRDLPFIEDPHIRLDKWGANAMSNILTVESDLKGIGRPFSRDYLNINEYTKYSSPFIQPSTYKTEQRTITDESRSTCPAFQFRGIEIPRWETPFINPQSVYELPFHNHLIYFESNQDSYMH